MTSLTIDLSRMAGEAFAAEGLDSAFGTVQISDRPDLAHHIVHGALVGRIHDDRCE